MRKINKFSVINGKGSRKKVETKKIFVLLLFAVAAILTIRFIYNFTYNKVASSLVRTVVSDTGILESAITVKGIIVRHERLVAAPSSGELTWVAQDRAKVPVGMQVAVISSDQRQDNVKTPVTGVVVRQLDGFEGMLQPQNLEGINPRSILRMPMKVKEINDGDEIQQGTFMFKLVNDFSWFFVVQVTPDNAEVIRGLNRQRLRFPFAEELVVNAKLSLDKTADDDVVIAFEITDHVEGYLEQRMTEAAVITSQLKGIFLPVSALVEREDEKGVYILHKSVVRYRSVEVVGLDKEHVVVEGLPIGLKVISNPSLVREGMRL